MLDEQEGQLRLVGIGASAGGLRSLEVILDGLKETSNSCFVVLQHLSPDFDSIIDQLLRRHTSMTVRVLEDGDSIEPNTLLLVPPGRNAICSSGRILLTEREGSGHASFPIDEFFRSVAQTYGDRSVGIILSGNGADGARGIRSLRSAGGLVIVEEPSTADYSGMPLSAIDTGAVDLVLPAAEIAETLNRLKDGSACLLSDGPSSDGTVGGVNLNRQGLDSVFELLTETFRIDFSSYREELVARRVERRMTINGQTRLEDYVKLLRGSDSEVNSLYQDLLIGVTDFFRDPQVFECLASEVIPDLVRKAGEDKEIRIWVAGSATGEEAYSLAILCVEECERQKCERRIRIFASDAHEGSLNVGIRGVYQSEQLTGVTADRQSRFFIERHDGFHVAPDVRKMVVFTPHNVLHEAPFTRLDFVSCRNLLIYLTPSAQQRVLSLFHFGLKPDGVLCLGASETLGDLRSEFQEIDGRLRVYRRHRETSVSLVPGKFRAVPSIATRQTGLAASDRTPEGASQIALADRVLEKLDRPALVLSSDHRLQYVLGGAGRYLGFRDGRTQGGILDMLLPELRSAVALGLIHCQRMGSSVELSPVSCTVLGTATAVGLVIDYLNPEAGPSASFLIEFRPAGDGQTDTERTVLMPEDLSSVADIERELQFTRNSLQSTISELQTTNEELQSTNEQLTASNEELQSTNEELHSVNEELYTVNAEHQRKIDELTELNDDIDNLLVTTNVHTVFLDANLRLRRFTPQIAELFHLVPQDIGRKISSFTHRLTGLDLPRCTEQVIQSGKPWQQEVGDDTGRWYLLRIFPYRSRGDIEGAVVTLVEVSSLRQATLALQESQDRFDLAARGSNAGIWEWKDVSADEIWCSVRMKEILGLPESESFSFSKWMELLRPSDGQAMKRLLQDHLEQGTAFDIECRMRCGLDDSHEQWVHIRGTAERRSSDLPIRMAGSLENVTLRREAEEEVRRGVKLRDQFLAMLSHELRNPLGAVTNAVALLANEDTSDEARDMAVRVAKRQLVQISRLMDDLLDVARITHGRLELDRQPMDLRDVVDEALSVAQSMVCDSDLQISVVTPELPVMIQGDFARIEQMTVNLLANAVKYTLPKGRLSVELVRTSDMAELTIQDTGVGIATEQLPAVFSLFFQADDTLDRSQGGMGVGLTLVQRIVELHGGQVTIHSDGRNQGTRVVVQIPLLLNAVARPSEQDQLADGARIENVVLVEDQDDARTMLAGLLRLKGITVLEAANGPDGLAAVLEHRPDAAILDIGLPGMSGHELARKIRENPAVADTRLIALTGYGQENDCRDIVQSGFDQHVIKPLDPDRLEEILRGGQSRPVDRNEVRMISAVSAPSLEDMQPARLTDGSHGGRNDG